MAKASSTQPVPTPASSTQPVPTPASTYTVRLYMKSPKVTKRPTKAIMAEIRHGLATSRQPRADLLAALEAGEIHALPRMTPAQIRDAAKRRRDFIGPNYCYTFTAADRGRAKTSAGTTAASIRAWIVKYIVAAGALGENEFAIVVDID